MREATLLLIFRGQGINREILLAKKKRGFGLDKWNGPGGKVNTESGELPEKCVIREAKEEVNLDIKSVELVGEFLFEFPHNPESNFHCYLYTTEEFSGEASESEEMAPCWFRVTDIPYEHMWDDDKIWLPLILQGNHISGTFVFNEQGKVVNHRIT